MSLAVITDSSVNLPAEIQGHADVYVLDIPVIIEGQPFVEGKNLDVNQFYAQMANFEELLKTSQPNLADLDNLLTELEEKGYTHVIGLFLSSGISGFWANSQILIEDHAKLKIAFPDTKITAAPMGAMVRNVLHWSAQGMSFESILKKLEEQVDQTTAYILVDDLNHLDVYKRQIQPFEDCCTIFAPDRPKTNPKIKNVEQYERRMDVDALVERAVAGIMVTEITPIEEAQDEVDTLIEDLL